MGLPGREAEMVSAWSIYLGDIDSLFRHPIFVSLMAIETLGQITMNVHRSIKQILNA